MSAQPCDSNVWLALALSGHVHHSPARAWLETVDEPDSILFCRATQQAFLRLLTNAAVLAPYGNEPLTDIAAWGAYEAFIADDRIGLRADEPAGLEACWQGFAWRDTSSPNLWMDAYLAAYAVSGHPPGHHGRGVQPVRRNRPADPGIGCSVRPIRPDIL